MFLWKFIFPYLIIIAPGTSSAGTELKSGARGNPRPLYQVLFANVLSTGFVSLHGFLESHFMYILQCMRHVRL